MKYLVVIAIAAAGLLAACKEETKKTETTVTQPTPEAPAKVEEKTTTEETK